MCRRVLLAMMCLFSLGVLNAPVWAGVTVNFIEPEKYTDIGRPGRNSERNLKVVRDQFERLGTRCLAEGETLAIEVIDVDLAGREEWWHGAGHDLRVLRDITWPRLDLRYIRRDAAGTVLQQDREQVADMNYLWRSAYVRLESEPLPYERAMLRAWFERRFCRQAAAK